PRGRRLHRLRRRPCPPVAAEPVRARPPSVSVHISTGRPADATGRLAAAHPETFVTLVDSPERTAATGEERVAGLASLDRAPRTTSSNRASATIAMAGATMTIPRITLPKTSGTAKASYPMIAGIHATAIAKPMTG